MDAKSSSKYGTWSHQDMKPNDGREWRTADDVALRLGIKRKSAAALARVYQWTRVRQPPYRMWILKADVDKYIEFIERRKRWYKKRQPRTWREEICSDYDLERAKELFWSAEQAALYMGVTARTIRRWGQKGKIAVFVTNGKGRGRKAWYSPASMHHVKEDMVHQEGTARWEKAKATMQAGIVSREVYKQRHKPQFYRNVPDGWISVREVAERLGVAQGTVRRLRQRGRLFGRQWIKGRLEDTQDWLQKELACNRHWFFRAEDIEEYKQDEEAARLREQGRRANQIACRK